jgi:hypothetical protein
VADSIGLEHAIAASDLVITGEGRLDRQTERGNAPIEVALRAKRLGVVCMAIAGEVAAAPEVFADVRSLAALARPGEDTRRVPRRLLRRVAASVVRQVTAGQRNGEPAWQQRFYRLWIASIKTESLARRCSRSRTNRSMPARMCEAER